MWKNRQPAGHTDLCRLLHTSKLLTCKKLRWALLPSLLFFAVWPIILSLFLFKNMFATGCVFLVVLITFIELWPSKGLSAIASLAIPAMSSLVYQNNLSLSFLWVFCELTDARILKSFVKSDWCHKLLPEGPTIAKYFPFLVNSEFSVGPFCFTVCYAAA